MRSAAIYVAVLFLPFTFVAMIWPQTARWCRKLIDVLVAVIAAKFVIVAIMALAAAGLGQSRGEDAFQGVLAGAALMLLAAFSPFALLKLLPFAEAAIASAGSARGAVGRSLPGASVMTPAMVMRLAMDRNNGGGGGGALRAAPTGAGAGAGAGGAAAATGPFAAGAAGASAAQAVGGAVRSRGEGIGRHGEAGSSPEAPGGLRSGARAASNGQSPAAPARPADGSSQSPSVSAQRADGPSPSPRPSTRGAGDERAGGASGSSPAPRGGDRPVDPAPRPSRQED